MRFRESDNPKNKRLFVRVTDEEKADIESRARDCCMSVSAFLLKAAQGRQTRTRHDLSLVLELCAIADLLREIYRSEKPREASELEPVLKAVVQEINRIGEGSRIRI